MSITNEQLQKAISAFDAANERDPHTETDEHGQTQLKELLYARRMSETLADFEPEASAELQLAARSQHLERWVIPRDEYPMDRPGYKRWRQQLAVHHAERAGELMRELAIPEENIERVQTLLQKKRLKRDEEVQTLEDVICLVFLRHYLADFARKHEDDKLISIIRKTWKKMSPRGQEVALALPLPDDMAQLVGRALAEPKPTR